MIESVEKYYRNLKEMNQILTQYERMHKDYDLKYELVKCYENEIISKDMYNKLETRYY